MTNQTHTADTLAAIPQEMLDAAIRAILKVRGCSDEYIAEVEAREYPGWEIGENYAQAALESADVPALLARIAELEAELRNIAEAKNANFEDAEEFRAWAKSRASWTLSVKYEAGVAHAQQRLLLNSKTTFDVSPFDEGWACGYEDGYCCAAKWATRWKGIAKWYRQQYRNN